MSDGTLRCFLFCKREPQELNVLKSHLRITIQTLLSCGKSQREIERVTGVDRKTIRRYAQPAGEAGRSNSPGVATGFCAGETGDFAVQTPPPRPPAPVPKEARSACEAHRDWITAQPAPALMFDAPLSTVTIAFTPSGTTMIILLNPLEIVIEASRLRSPEKSSV